MATENVLTSIIRTVSNKVKDGLETKWKPISWARVSGARMIYSSVMVSDDPTPGPVAPFCERWLKRARPTPSEGPP